MNSPISSIRSSESKSEFFTKELLYESDLKDFKKFLEKSSTCNELIEFGKNRFPNAKQYLFQRIIELTAFFDSEEEGEISLASLKSMLLFLFSIKNIKRPVITLNDMGIFQTNWKSDRNNLLTTSFIENYALKYVIFRPSHHTSGRIILNGTMNILDFKDYLIELGLQLYREKNERDQ